MKVFQVIEPPAESISTDVEEMSRYGIRKVSIEYFYLGMYGYVDLKDAVAQAKRELKSAVLKN